MPARLTERVSLEGGCFLCSPAPELLSWRSERFFVLAGLGPVVDGFCLIGARDHARSMADIAGSDAADERDAVLSYVRLKLGARFGGCLVTEHGRVPVCDRGEQEHDVHCFHAHFLVFPSAPDITDAARSYYRFQHSFHSASDALTFAASCDEYLFISPSPGRYEILSGQLNAPRQLARTLVASATRNFHLADWRLAPQPDRTLATASELTLLMRGEVTVA